MVWSPPSFFWTEPGRRVRWLLVRVRGEKNRDKSFCPAIRSPSLWFFQWENSTSARVFPSSPWERGRKTGHRSNTGHTPFTHHAGKWAMNSGRVFICSIFLSSDGALSERQPRRCPVTFAAPFSDSYASPGPTPVMVTNETPAHRYHPAKIKTVIELNSSTTESSKRIRKIRSSQFIRGGSETRARLADKLQRLTWGKAPEERVASWPCNGS